MKALVGQLQPQRILPVNPRPHGLRRWPITQLLHALHDADEGEWPGMEGWLACAGVDGAEQLIVKKGVQLIAQPQVDIAAWECRVGHTRGLHWNKAQVVSWQAHYASLPLSVASFPSCKDVSVVSSPTVSNSR
jgi:hypothetical protein